MYVFAAPIQTEAISSNSNSLSPHKAEWHSYHHSQHRADKATPGNPSELAERAPLCEQIMIW